MKVHGATVDKETRCVHYRSEKDIVAIKFKCCQRYYPCYQCHEEDAGHPIQRWVESEWGTRAILCGHCQTELTIIDYMQAVKCPACGHAFNEGCEAHYPIYFQMDR
jgi:uncharacterized CHY-type Zn-finger protein